MRTDKKSLTDIENEYLYKILKQVSVVAEISIDAMQGKSRKPEIVIARQLYCYLAYTLKTFNVSYARIGSFICRDHTTVIYSIKKVEDAIDVQDAPIMRVLHVFAVDNLMYNKYELVWTMPKLTDLIKNGETLDFAIVLEKYNK